MSTRTMAHAGTFYPADSAEVIRYLKTFEAAQQNDPLHTPRAVIVPHAGYIYSGFTAESAYRCLNNCRAKRGIVIGPSHRMAYDGMSVSRFDDFATPLGTLQIDREYADQIIGDFSLSFDPGMHREHSTEVQMPFIKYFAPQLQVIEMVYGFFSPETLGGIINVLLNDEENLYHQYRSQPLLHTGKGQATRRHLSQCHHQQRPGTAASGVRSLRENRGRGNAHCRQKAEAECRVTRLSNQCRCQR